MLGKSGSDPDLQIIFKKRGQTPKLKKNSKPRPAIAICKFNFQLAKAKHFYYHSCMIPRIAEHRIRSLCAQFPSIIITGPRQSGKTTLAKALFPDRPYLNLELPDTLERISHDPRGTLYPLRRSGAVIDEAQRFPEISSWLQGIIDEEPKAGTWILTGSDQPGLRQSVSQTLVGRAAYARLFPFVSDELSGNPIFSSSSTDEIIQRGWYPPLFDRPFVPSDWYEQYVALYLERDLSRLINIKDLSQFRKFLSLCAGRTGQLLNLSDLARDAGTSHTTARSWLSVLEQSFIVFELQPFYRNFQKRIIKSPKLYFYDSGLAAWLIGIREPGQVTNHPLRGNLFETMVIADIIKRSEAIGTGERFSFWNAPSSGEVDLVIERGTEISAIEVKSTATFRPELASGLEKWSRLASLPPERLAIAYDGNERFQFKGINIIPWRAFGQ
ncbi:MAG TPA: AAA family ATPase [Spirochaetaceae bacterium]|nr:AAA family ATPase [Spirochaetaceae bacterium]